MHDNLRGPIARIRWLPFQNVGQIDIPPFALMMVTGCATVNKNNVLKVKQPDGATSNIFVVNWGMTVSKNDFGQCTMDWPMEVAHDSSGGTSGPIYGPAFGDSWGPVANQWTLTKGNGGFEVMGVQNAKTQNNTNPTNARVLVKQVDSVVWAFPNTAVQAGFQQVTMNVTRYTTGGNPGTIVKADADPTLGSSQTIVAGAECRLMWDNLVLRWLIVSWSC